jgi:hypothetical protein
LLAAGHYPLSAFDVLEVSLKITCACSWLFFDQIDQLRLIAPNAISTTPEMMSRRLIRLELGEQTRPNV